MRGRMRLPHDRGSSVLVPTWLRKLLTVDDAVLNEQFTLIDQPGQPGPGDAQSGNADVGGANTQGERGDAPGGEGTEDQQQAADRGRGREGAGEGRDRQQNGLITRPFTKPVSIREFIVQNEHRYESETEAHSTQEDPVFPDLDRSLHRVQELFHLPENKDIVIREFRIGTESRWRAFVVFIDGLTDRNTTNLAVLQPLMLLSSLPEVEPARRIETVLDVLLPGNQVQPAKTWPDVVSGILAGSTALFVDGSDTALLVETKGWEHRTVGLPQVETVVRGPKEAFTELFRANTALVRSFLRSEHLVTEMFKVGRLGQTDVAVMYIKGIANPRLVDEVKRRIESIEVDYLPDSGLFEQFIEDSPKHILPQVFSTERPDRIAHLLTEGHVAIFVGNSPFALAVPVVFWTLMHTPEDAYLRYPFGSFLRIIRWIALLVALLLPGFYVALTNYHPEMIPTDLMLAIAGSREMVPFPVIMEVLMMEFAIELIREAGIRIPSVIGPTIGIVGALIIGQAAVQAGIVSPLLVIVIATTSLASFAIPNYNLGMGVRILRFIFLLAAAVFGFYGMALMFWIVLARLSVQKSFGVPLLAPVSPSMGASRDVILRGPAYVMNERPTYLQPFKRWRQNPETRPWSVKTRPVDKDPSGRRGGKR